ncbi:MAG: tetratricopeptide repeat protein [Chitinispirillaceae bacterium]
MKGQLLYPAALITVLVFSLGAAPKTENPVSIVPCRAVDAGNFSKHDQNTWFPYLADEYIRFRMEQIESVVLPSTEQISSKFPKYRKFTGIDENRYLDAAIGLGADYVLFHTYRIDKKSGSVHYSMQLVSAKSRKPTFSTEENISFTQIGKGLDKCLLGMLKSVSQRSASQTIHFKTDALGPQFRYVKKTGELLSRKRSRAADYEEITRRAPKNRLAVYISARLHYRAGNFAAAANEMKKLLKVNPSHKTLNLMLVHSLRLAGDLSGALSHSRACEKMNLKSPPFILERALIYEGQKNLSAALKAHKQVISLDPDEPISLFFLAKANNDAKDFTKGYEYGERLVKRSPDNGSAVFEYARSLAGLREFKRAQRAAAKAQELLPESEQAALLLADIHMHGKNYSAAARMYRTAAEINPNNIQSHLNAAKAIEKEGKLLECYQYLKSHENRFSKDTRLMRQLGLLASRIDNTKSARKYLEAAAGNSNKDGSVLLSLAKCYLDEKAYDKAIEHFNKALPLTKDKSRCRLGLARSYLQKNDPKAAQAQLRKLLGKKPPKDVHQLMGDAYLLENDTKNALVHYKNERYYHGASAYLQKQIAVSLYEHSKLKESRIEFRKLTKLQPDNPEPYYYLAVIALRWGLRSRAEARLKTAQSLGSGDAHVHYLLGKAYAQNKLYPEAIEHYETALHSGKPDSDLLSKLSDAQFKAGMDREAAETLVKLYKLNPSANQKSLARAGHVFRKLKLHDKAKWAFDTFLKRGFKDESVNAALARIVYREKNFSGVISLLESMNRKSSHFSEDHELMLGHAYVESGKHEAALPLLRSFLSNNSGHNQALELCAVAYEKSGNVKKAAETYENLIRKSDEGAKYSHHLGTLYEKLGSQKKAMNRYKTNIAQNPKDLKSIDRLVRIYFGSKEWKKAHDFLQTAIKTGVAPPHFHLMNARALGSLGKIEASSMAYNHYLSLEDNKGPVWKEYGMLLYMNEEYAQAISVLQKAKRYMPNDAEIAFIQGVSLMKIDDYEDALRSLSTALTFDEKNTSILEKMAVCHRRLNNRDGLMKTLERWSELDMMHYDIRLELGTLYLNRGKTNNAVGALEVACDLRPAEEAPHRLLAKAYKKQKKDDLRLFHLEAAVNHAPENWDNHFQLARYHLSKGKPNRAEKLLAKTIELNPNHARAHFEYGRILMDKKEYRKAYPVLEKAALLNSENGYCLALYAYCASLMGETRISQKKIAAALKKSSDPQVLYLAGLVNQNSGKRENAKQVMAKALDKSPKDAQYLESMGDLLLEEMRYREACKNYFRAWERGGFDNEVAFKLGVALSHDRKFKEATDFFEKVLKSAPSNGEALYRLTDAYCGAGDLKKAQETLMRFDSRKNMEWKQTAQGRIYEAQGKNSPAWIAFTVAHKMNSDNPHVNAGYGRLLMKKESYKEAITYFTYAYSKDPSNADLLMNKAKCHEFLGQLNKAFDLYNVVVSRFPEHPEVHLSIAELKTKQRDYQAAITCLKKGLKLHPKNIDFHFKLGELYRWTEQYEKAIHAYKESSGGWFRKGNIEALRMIGHIYYSKLTDEKKAEKYFKKYVKSGGKKEKVDKLIKKLAGRS